MAMGACVRRDPNAHTFLHLSASSFRVQCPATHLMSRAATRGGAWGWADRNHSRRILSSVLLRLGR